MKLDSNEVKLALLGGAIAEIAFEFYAWVISPVLFGLELQPAKLVTALTQKFLNIGLSYEIAYALHTFVGIVGFSLFTLTIYKLLSLKGYISGLIAGLTLWFIAQGVLAPAIGRDFMMGFGPYTQSSFIGHVGMAIIIAIFLDWRLNKQTALSDNPEGFS
ncbi:MAG: hypothetical protein ACSHXY_04600 [Alphaproteobacteria bacterium]